MNWSKVAFGYKLFAFSLIFAFGSAMCQDIVFLNLTNNNVKTRIVYNLQNKDSRPSDREVLGHDILVVPVDNVAGELEISFCKEVIGNIQMFTKGYQYKYLGAVFNKIDLNKFKNKNILVVINSVNPSIDDAIVFKDQNSEDQYAFSKNGLFRGLLTFSFDDNSIEDIIKNANKIGILKAEFKSMNDSVKTKSIEFAKSLVEKMEEKSVREENEEKEIRAKENASWDTVNSWEQFKIMARRRLRDLERLTSTAKKLISDTFLGGDALGKVLFYTEKFGTLEDKEYVKILVKTLEENLRKYNVIINDISTVFAENILSKNNKSFGVNVLAIPITGLQQVIEAKQVKKVPEFKVLFCLNEKSFKDEMFKAFGEDMRASLDRMRKSVAKFTKQEVVFEQDNEKTELKTSIKLKKEETELERLRRIVTGNEKSELETKPEILKRLEELEKLEKNESDENLLIAPNIDDFNFIDGGDKKFLPGSIDPEELQKKAKEREERAKDGNKKIAEVKKETSLKEHARAEIMKRFGIDEVGEIDEEAEREDQARKNKQKDLNRKIIMTPVSVVIQPTNPVAPQPARRQAPKPPVKKDENKK